MGRRRLDRGTPRGLGLTLTAWAAALAALAFGGLDWDVAGHHGLALLDPVLIALIVGASRIYLGAHWLTDVLGGYALGALPVAVIVIVRLTPGRGGAAMVGSDLGGRES